MLPAERWMFTWTSVTVGLPLTSKAWAWVWAAEMTMPLVGAPVYWAITSARAADPVRSSALTNASVWVASRMT